MLALVDWFAKRPCWRNKPGIGVFGYGEGGAIALYAAALDTRIDAVCVSGYFDDRNAVWTEPIDRNVFGLLDQFGDAELASLVAPRTLDHRGRQGPGIRLSRRAREAPGSSTTPSSRPSRTRLTAPASSSPG